MTTTIDAQGRVVFEQVAGLEPATYSYDARGRLITATLGSGATARVATFAYNSQGYLARVTDPLARTVTFGYDAAGARAHADAARWPCDLVLPTTPTATSPRSRRPPPGAHVRVYAARPCVPLLAAGREPRR